MVLSQLPVPCIRLSDTDRVMIMINELQDYLDLGRMFENIARKDMNLSKLEWDWMWTSA